jgi:hypothetical protein
MGDYVPLWLQIILGFAAPIIAAAGVFVSWQQWLNGKRSLKHDLFDRRWKVYAATNDVIVSHINGTPDEGTVQLAVFLRSKMDAAFLCSDSVNEFLATVLNAVNDTRAMRRRHEGFTANAETGAQLLATEEALKKLHGQIVTVFREPLDLTDRGRRRTFLNKWKEWSERLPG